MKEPWLTLAVVGVVLRGDEILLVQNHGKGQWSLPGGHLEKGELPVNGLKREIKEELSVDIEVLNTLGMYIRLWDGDMAIAFSIKFVSADIQIGDDVKNYEFFPARSLPQITLRTQKIIDDVLNSRTSQICYFCDSKDSGRLVELLP